MWACDLLVRCGGFQGWLYQFSAIYGWNCLPATKPDGLWPAPLAQATLFLYDPYLTHVLLNITEDTWRNISIFNYLVTLRWLLVQQPSQCRQKIENGTVDLAPCLLMTWWLKEPGHQQPWYWCYYPGIFWVQHEKGWHWGLDKIAFILQMTLSIGKHIFLYSNICILIT